MSAATGQSSILGLAARIVSSHVANNAVQAADLPELIQTVHRALLTLGAAPVAEDKPEPAVPVRKSVFPDYIVCLEDGKKLKMLKRHLQTSYGLTPDAYRARWGLPTNYPMVAPSYAERRSALAKSIGLGRKPGPRAEAAESEEGAPAPARRGRKPGKAAAARA
ncbi:MAG: MucR family transcriptional regulator [Janthinobacterium lividum]